MSTTTSRVSGSDRASTPADATAPVLSVDRLRLDLTNGRGGVVQQGLVEGVSFEVHAKQTMALIGESGCGKTLTSLAMLRLLPDAIRIGAGSIMLDGVDLTALSERELRRIRGRTIGAIFQDPQSSLNPSMRVGDQIAESRRIHLGESRSEGMARAAELLELVGIPQPTRRMMSFPHEFSGGMQQRVMIAAALACDPLVLIADEPTTALDVTVQAEILELLASLQAENGMAIVLVTHDLGVVADVADHVLVMYAGNVAESATVGDLFSEPSHPYTQALMRSIPQAGTARTRLPIVHGRVPQAGSIPPGCRFGPRCGHFEAGTCDVPPVGVSVGPSGHRVVCTRFAEEGVLA